MWVKMAFSEGSREKAQFQTHLYYNAFNPNSHSNGLKQLSLFYIQLLSFPQTF